MKTETKRVGSMAVVALWVALSGGPAYGAEAGKSAIKVFKGNVKAFRTNLLADQAAEALYPTWSKDVERWQKTGGDRAYHYLGSAIWFTRIGHAMGAAMLELLPKKDQ